MDWGNKDYTDRDHAGYRKRGEHEQLDEYWIIPAVFESEICQKFEATKVCTVLHGVKWLNKPDRGWKHLRYGQGRHYVLIGIEPQENKKED